jgi:high affinity Mn2+ porin
VVEGLSPEARAYFAAGGLGVLIGDGQLNYRPEEILEAYCAYSLNKWATLTFDYQFIANPGYNADRTGFNLLWTFACGVLMHTTDIALLRCATS